MGDRYPINRISEYFCNYAVIKNDKINVKYKNKILEQLNRLEELVVLSSSTVVLSSEIVVVNMVVVVVSVFIIGAVVNITSVVFKGIIVELSLSVILIG